METYIIIGVSCFIVGFFSGMLVGGVYVVYVVYVVRDYIKERGGTRLTSQMRVHGIEAVKVVEKLKALYKKLDVTKDKLECECSSRNQHSLEKEIKSYQSGIERLTDKLFD